MLSLCCFPVKCEHFESRGLAAMGVMIGFMLMKPRTKQKPTFYQQTVRQRFDACFAPFWQLSVSIRCVRLMITFHFISNNIFNTIGVAVPIKQCIKSRGWRELLSYISLWPILHVYPILKWTNDQQYSDPEAQEEEKVPIININIRTIDNFTTIFGIWFSQLWPTANQKKIHFESRLYILWEKLFSFLFPLNELLSLSNFIRTQWQKFYM